jgi:hypothetical protein
MSVSIAKTGGAARVHYIPKWTEFAITASNIASGSVIFGWAVKRAPVFARADAEVKRREARGVG